jgi:hypothetical protein
MEVKGLGIKGAVALLTRFRDRAWMEESISFPG